MAKDLISTSRINLIIHLVGILEADGDLSKDDIRKISKVIDPFRDSLKKKRQRLKRKKKRNGRKIKAGKR